MKNISKLACLSLLFLEYDACASLQDPDRKEIITFFELNAPTKKMKCTKKTWDLLEKSQFKTLPKEELLRRMIEPELPMTMPYQSVACQVVERPAQDPSVSAVKSPVTVMALLNSPVYKKYQDQYPQNHSDVTLGASDDTLLSQNGTVAATLSTGQKKAQKKKQPVHSSQDQVSRENEATKTASINSARLVASRSVLAAVVPQRTHAMKSLAGGCDQHVGVGKVSKKVSQSSKKQKFVNKFAQEESDDAALAEFMEVAKKEKKDLTEEIALKLLDGKGFDGFQAELKAFGDIVDSFNYINKDDPLFSLRKIKSDLTSHINAGCCVTQCIIDPLKHTTQCFKNVASEYQKAGENEHAALVKSWYQECINIQKILKPVKMIDMSLFADHK